MINATYIIAAYGRNYKSFDQALTDWNNGLDFKICCGAYCSKRDFGLLDSVYVIINQIEFKLQ